ncbi:MAG: hypothetical protein JWR85_2470 [Marmoricola sp.]|nr:hypothetical protein [Marmoricola sp.]
MKRLLACSAAALVALLLAGCGSGEPASAGDKDAGKAEPGSAKVGPCPIDSPAVTSARTIATVDLDGDGQGDPVRLTRPDGDCASLLFAQVGDGFVEAQLPVGEPPLSTAFGVQVPGREGQLLVTRQDHPRGGFQLRVYAAGADDLAELKVDGHTLVPFVALDVQEHPLSVDCTAGGVVITEAVAHEPAGVMFAWDIKRTSYAVDGSQVTPGASQEIADNVLQNQLAKTYPDLVKHTAFKSCSG